ncbi:MAG: outer membrane beta-barrel protein [Chromatiales bacterium]|nr:outer membrane beta-barrel protein [Chromatiales bacterium]
MSKSLAVLVAMSMAAPSLAVAGPYIGVGIGGTRTESTLTELGLFPGPALPVPAPPTPDPNFAGDDDFTSNDVSFDVAVGWMFGRFGVEIGYTDFGSAEQRYVLPESCNNLGCQSREWTAKMEMSGYRAFLVGSFPFNDSVDAYLKVGAMNWDADYAGFERNQAFVPGPPIAPRYDEVTFSGDDTALAAAMGINLKTDSPFSVRVEFNYYDVDTTDMVWNAQLMGVYTF